MSYVAKNNAYSTLAGSLTNVATSAAVQAGKGALFAVTAPDYTYATLEDAAGNIEVIKVTARSTDSLTIVRAQDGTSARSWNAGDVIECRPCAAAMNDYAVGPQIDGSTAKTTPVDADKVGILDSAASMVLKYVTWANVKATLKAYFDSIYRLVSDDVSLAAGKVVIFEGATDDAFETTLTVTDPTADRTITLPDVSGTAALIGGTNNGLLDISGAAGGQIKFPATQNASADANTLDDYEEGTFTGTLTGVSGSVTGTIRYVKTGGMVTIAIDGGGGGARVSGTSNATTKTITGMPATLYPSQTRYSIATVQDSAVGAFVAAVTEVNTSGVISVYSTMNFGVWTASGTCYIYPNCITYPI